MKVDVMRSIRRHLLAGVAASVLLVAGVGGWAATTEISGAVIAQGLLVVDTNVKKVQHPTGGVVGELRVKDGDHVKAGDIVIRLDDTQTRANLAIVTKGLDEFAARRAREEAERDGETAIAFPADLLARMNDPEVAHIVNGERKLFETRLSARTGQREQLRERVVQSNEEITGLVTQQKSREDQIGWVDKELEGVRDLWQKNLVQFTRVTQLEREKVRLEGERGQLIAQIAQTRGKIAETELQIIQIDQDMRTEVGKDLAEIRAKTAELVEKKVAAEDQLKRIDIRAPQDGVVLQLSVHTVGGVVAAGDQLMLIVPESDALSVEAKIAPQDIDQVHLGQQATLRFTSFNQRTTPELNGEVSRVSADVTQDQKTNAYFYTVRISLSDAEMNRLGKVKLIPGMPVEAFVQTNERRVLSYLVRPLHDQITRAFREK
ncbi:MAG: HlyD family type I secretion periplasmic adaptor subunit [Alphaproteobacteria bacterium]|nr:HlyD family type I secretion periplasmic adaptor subunit [Alphaproteobacteria bacterium]